MHVRNCSARSVRMGIKSLLYKVSPPAESLCCVLEQDALSTTKLLKYIILYHVLSCGGYKNEFGKQVIVKFFRMQLLRYLVLKDENNMSKACTDSESFIRGGTTEL